MAMEKDVVLSLRIILTILVVLSTLSVRVEGTKETFCGAYIVPGRISPDNSRGSVYLYNANWKKRNIHFPVILEKSRVYSVSFNPRISSSVRFCSIQLAWISNVNVNTEWYLTEVIIESCGGQKQNYTFSVNAWIKPYQWIATSLSVLGGITTWSAWGECSERNIRYRNTSCKRTPSACPKVVHRCSPQRGESQNCSLIDKTAIPTGPRYTDSSDSPTRPADSTSFSSLPTSPQDPTCVGMIIGAAAGGGVLLIAIIVLVIILIYKRKRKRNAEAENRESSGLQLSTSPVTLAHGSERIHDDVSPNVGGEYADMADADLMLSSLPVRENSPSNNRNYSSVCKSSAESIFANCKDNPPKPSSTPTHLSTPPPAPPKPYSTPPHLSTPPHPHSTTPSNPHRPSPITTITPAIYATVVKRTVKAADIPTNCGNRSALSTPPHLPLPTTTPPPPPPKPYSTPPHLSTPPHPHSTTPSNPHRPSPITTTTPAIYATVVKRTVKAADIPTNCGNRSALRHDDYEGAIPITSHQEDKGHITNKMRNHVRSPNPNENDTDVQ